MAGSLSKKQGPGEVEIQKRRIARKEYRRLWNEFEIGGFMAQKGLQNVARGTMLLERRALQKEGDIVIKYKTMHEEIFLSSWLRDRLLFKEGVSTLFPVMPPRNSVPWSILTVVRILGETLCGSCGLSESVPECRRVCLL